jgi:hypothetical protein
VRLRGLLLLQTFDKKVVVHAIDGGPLSIPPHSPVLRIRKSQIDHGAANNLPPSRIELLNKGTSKETWQWDLKGKQVRFHEQEPTSDTLTFDTTQPTLPNPGENGSWQSTLLLPDLKKLTGATHMTRFDASAVQITLRDGRLEADKPHLHNGMFVVWTFRDPNGQELSKQAFSDTAVYKCPLNGQAPVVRVDSGTITLCSGESEFVSIENMMTPPPVPTTQDPPFSLLHFHAFYALVDGAFEPVETPQPASKSACSNCDVDPFFCPPARI